MAKVSASKKKLRTDMFNFNNSSVKKEVVPESNCPEELSILKKWLLDRSFAPKN